MFSSLIIITLSAFPSSFLTSLITIVVIILRFPRLLLRIPRFLDIITLIIILMTPLGIVAAFPPLEFCLGEVYFHLGDFVVDFLFELLLIFF